MAFKSKAQKEHFEKELATGKIAQSFYDQMESGTDYEHLPERLHAKQLPAATRKMLKEWAKDK